MNALLLSMPGTPVIYYGDEIGMGDNIYLGDRDGVRTPMQWSPDRNGGFSRANPQQLYAPPIQDPIFGFQAVNVEAQQQSPGSLLNWMKRLIAVRQRPADLRARHAHLPLPAQPQGPGLSARARGRDDLVRLQPVAQRAGLRPGARGLPRPGAGRAAGPHRLPTDRRSRLPPDPARLRLLLAGAGRGRPSSPAGTSPRPSPCPNSSPSSSTTAGAPSARAAAAATLPGRCCRNTCPSRAGSRTRPVEGVRLARAGEVRGRQGNYLLAELDGRAGRRPRQQCFFLPFAAAWGEENLAPGGAAPALHAGRGPPRRPRSARSTTPPTPTTSPWHSSG